MPSSGTGDYKLHLSWLTNSALVYEPKCGGGGVGGSQPRSTAVHRSPNKLRRPNSIFNLVRPLPKREGLRSEPRVSKKCSSTFLCSLLLFLLPVYHADAWSFFMTGGRVELIKTTAEDAWFSSNLFLLRIWEQILYKKINAVLENLYNKW
jgi:hypothetical protein